MSETHDGLGEGAEAPRKGRGPTRPAVRAADLFMEIDAEGMSAAVLEDITAETGPAALGAMLKDVRAKRAATLAAFDAEIRALDARREFMSRYHELPEAARTAVRRMLRPDPEAQAEGVEK